MLTGLATGALAGAPALGRKMVSAPVGGSDPGFGPKTPARGSDGLAITGHAVATRIAIDVLREGGNACDALLAATIAQTVLEPHLTTVTGCFSMLYHEAAKGRTRYLNGNVDAPMALDGLSAADVPTGRAVAVPGFWAGYEAAWKAFASRPLRRLMAPAIDLARDGVECGPFLWGEIYAAQAMIGRAETGRGIFMPARTLPAPGSMIRQVAAADLLDRLCEDGSGYFYHGRFAERFCDITRAAGGVITPEDFARYQVRWDEPVRGTYRDLDIVAAAAPDMGGVHLVEALNMIELHDVARSGPASESPETLRHMMLAVREVLSAGATYGDPRHVPLPLDRILSKDFAHRRLQAGKAPDRSPPPPPGSCHLTVVDRWGNIATALHSTLSAPWVNGLFIDGVSICGAGNHFLRTMPPPGARISVMICPNILFRAGRPVLASGSPSTSLIANLVQNITNIVDCGMTVEESVSRASFGGFGETAGALTIEGDMAPPLLAAVEQAGIATERLNPWSFRHGSFEGIFFNGQGGAHGCGDPRRTSVAMAV